MNKKIILPIIVLLLLLISVFTIYSKISLKSLSTLVHFKSDEITQISFIYSDEKKNGITVGNEENIKEFINKINSCVLRKKIIQSAGMAYNEKALFYIDNKIVSTIYFGKYIHINGTYYSMVKGDLTPAQIDNFLTSIKLQ